MTGEGAGAEQAVEEGGALDEEGVGRVEHVDALGIPCSSRQRPRKTEPLFSVDIGSGNGV